MVRPVLPVAIGLLAAIAVSPTQACELPPAADPGALETIQGSYSLRQDPQRHENHELDLAAFTQALQSSDHGDAALDARAQETRYSECLTQLIRKLAHIENGTREVLIDTLSITGRADWRLSLQNLSLPFTLIFANAHLNGLSLASLLTPRSIELRNVENHHTLFIGSSEVQGPLLLIKYKQTRPRDYHDGDDTFFRVSTSRFDSELHFESVSVPGTLRIHDNKVLGPLSVIDSDLGTLRLVQNHFDDLGVFATTVDGMNLYSNTSDALELRTVESRNNIYIYQNTFNDTVTLNDVFAHNKISFDSNTVNSQIHLTVGSGAEPGPDVAVNVASNLVKGQFEVQLDVPALRETLIQETRSSQVTRSTPFSFARYQTPPQETTTPELPQPMLVSFSRSIFEDVVSISMTSPRATLGVHGVLDPYSSAPLRDYCFRNRGAAEALRIDLRHARAEKVEWGLPLGDCRFRWMGEDFRFGDFEPGRRAANADGVADDGASTMAWRFQLHRPEPSALLAMAGNADDGGRFSDARQLRYDAKEMHYKPDCNDFTLNCFGKYSMFSYLWLSGFGVKPERVLTFLLGVWFFFFVVYYFYYASMREKAECRVVYEVPRRLVPIGRFVLSRLGGDPTRVDSIEDHGDPPPGFHYYSHRKPAADFALSTFSLDATLPVVNLHLYDTYYPAKTWALVCAYVQHVFGWMLVTSLLTSVAVL